MRICQQQQKIEVGECDYQHNFSPKKRRKKTQNKQTNKQIDLITNTKHIQDNLANIVNEEDSQISTVSNTHLDFEKQIAGGVEKINVQKSTHITTSTTTKIKLFNFSHLLRN